MEERKKKRIKILVIIIGVILSVIAIVETGLLLSAQTKLDNLNNDYEQIQDRLEKT